MDFVNIHLFHDASNLAACEEFPSVYCKSRRRALVHTLERFEKDTANSRAPYFVFGDFNFRCDTEGVVKKLTEALTAHRVANKSADSVKVQYRDSEGQNVLTVGKKEFTHADHQTQFKGEWLRKFDRELDPLREILFEYPVSCILIFFCCCTSSWLTIPLDCIPTVLPIRGGSRDAAELHEFTLSRMVW